VQYQQHASFTAEYVTFTSRPAVSTQPIARLSQQETITMSTDTRTPAERRYDAERSGEQYIRQELPEDTAGITAFLEAACDDGNGPDPEIHTIIAILERAEQRLPPDVPLDDDELAILEALINASDATSEDAE
jgi:hypothetical protein